MEVTGSWAKEAVDKLTKELGAGRYGAHAKAMKAAVYEALVVFCKQDEEFAQAVAQGGSFEACMAEVEKNCRNALSDLEAFRRAVRFYFVGADVKFHMTVNLCGDVEDEEEPERELEREPSRGRKVISLDDFLI